MLDPYLSPEDKEWVVKFTDAVEEIVKTTGVHSDLNLFVVADSIGLDLSVLHKEGTLMYALWVALLYVLKNHLTMEDFKYQTCEEFLEAYDGRFSSESDKEKNYLFQTANWMHLLFKMITARKNKGLALQVIPKVVEGFDVKYVTGSGQTKATANRVHVFEVEGNTKANQRGKIRTKKKVVPGEKKVKLQEDNSNDEDDEEPQPKKARKKRSPKLPMVSSFITPYDSGELGTRSREKRTREAIATMYEAALAVESQDLVEDGMQIAEEGSIAADVQKAYYKLMRDSSCSSVLSYTRDLDLGALGGSGPPPYDYSRDFSRGISLGGLDPLNFIQLGGPSELQRGFSWTEIPVNTNVSQYSGFGGSQQQQDSSSSSGGNFEFEGNAPSAEEQEAELEAAIAAAAAEDAAALKSANNSTDIDTISSSSGSGKVLDRNLSSSSLADIFRDFSK
jgi:hypothetical protein